MAEPIIGGPDSKQPQVPRASHGGCQYPTEIPYSAPVGPKGITDPKTAGLHGAVHDCGSQGKR